MTDEDQLIVAFCGADGTPEVRQAIAAQAPDWAKILETATANRLSPLLLAAIGQAGALDRLPPDVRREFETQALRATANARNYLGATADLLRQCEARHLDVVVLRGLTLAVTLYDSIEERPFSDLDVLVRASDVDAVATVFRESGFATAHGALSERYFRRHHLHLLMRHAERRLCAEVHWRLDHPYTLHTIDYSALFAARRRVDGLGTTLPTLCPEDTLLTLCLHLLKHCPYLPTLTGGDDVATPLLRDNQMLWLLDIYRLLQRQGNGTLDWKLAAARAAEWGLLGPVWTCLEAVARVFGLDRRADWPAARAQTPCGLRRRVYARRIASLRAAGGAAAPAFLFRTRAEAVFKPIRALDLIDYLFPPPDFIRRRYGTRDAGVAARYPVHWAKAVVRLAANLAEYLWESSPLLGRRGRRPSKCRKLEGHRPRCP